ncbi:carbohydrate ABC transporter permease [Microbacterium enclense]|uniref:carbohydrate ABC transporter permease n=1 Tax=Microbacterium enclense TaxID=993073 RepID=UPI003D73FFE1
MRTRPKQLERSGVIYLIPFVVIFGVFGLFPLIYSGVVSLNDVDLRNPTQMTFIGLENYTELFADPFFWNALRNTLTLGILACGPQLVLALVVANLLNYRMRYQTFWRVMVLMPYATSVAAATLIFAQLYGRDYGLVNSVINALGLPAVDWQAGTFASQFAIATIVTWRWMGYNALIYLASMQSIPDELYEAAELDGASKWRQFMSVTLPSIRGTILFTVIISTIGAMQLFVEPLLFEGASIGVQGGVSRQYQTLTLYMYQQGWSFFNLGYASSIAFTILLIVIIALGIGYVGRVVAQRGRQFVLKQKAVL